MMIVTVMTLTMAMTLMSKARVPPMTLFSLVLHFGP